MNWSQLEPMIADLQHREVATMNKMEQLASENSKLPIVPMSFTSAKKLVADSPYDVVVCGEVKKGKSSLLNAIIGQEILPVNSEIATSQVFRISNSTQESFELVFTDGTRQRISRDELSRYGSQVDANLQGEPMFQNRTLSYIQVNVPIAFLPNGVSLVDTPGLGALYKSHEWITQNYLRNASAILFVLDPERPIEAQEKKFILRALDITEDILFVMTKIDLYTPEAWSSIIQRNEAILADIYASKGLAMPEIKPVSSFGLMKASTGKVEALKAINLKNSKFPELKDELIRIMFRGVGILRTGLALNEASNYVNKAQSIIDDMQKVCVVDNEQEQRVINERKRNQQERLQSDWGQQSQLRQDIIAQIGSICGRIQEDARRLVSTNGSIYQEYLAKIKSLKNLDEAAKLGKTMEQKVVNDVSSQWQSIAQQAENQVAIVLSSANTQIGNIGYGSVGGKTGTLEVQELSALETISCWRGAALFGSVSTALAAAVGAFAVPVIGPIIGVAVGLVSWLFGKSKTQANEMERNKQNFQQKLSELMNELSVKLLHSKDGSRSVVGQFAYELDNNAKNAIQSIFERRISQLEREIADIERQARADIEERRRASAMWNKARQDWDSITSELQQEISLRNEIMNALK